MKASCESKWAAAACGSLSVRVPGHGVFSVAQAFTHPAFTGFANGIHLGRYWSIGPQQTLFVPGVWLRGDEENKIVVLELEAPDWPGSYAVLSMPPMRPC